MSSASGAYTTVRLSIDVAVADTELVAAIAGKKIRVHGYVLTNDAASAVKASFVSDGASDTTIASFNIYGAGGPIMAPYCDQGWFETLPSEALDLRQTTTDDMDGHLIYSVVD